jgi:group I intron endonuclease
MSSGIYIIENMDSGHAYIGQSINLTKRIRDHRSALKRGGHFNAHLQHAVNQTGIDNFSFRVLIECESFALDALEKLYIFKYKIIGKSYNLDSGGNKQKTVSIETRTKQSLVRVGKKQSDITKKRISQSLRGKTKGTPSYQTRIKLSKASSKIPDEVIQLIKLDTRSTRKVAKNYGVSQTIVSRIRRNKGLRYVER